jgi:hypothetical protein
VPRVILNDLGERIGDLVDKEPFPPFFVASYARPAQPKRSQNQRFGFQIEIKENKTPGEEHYSIRQALNCQLGLKINQANLPS